MSYFPTDIPFMSDEEMEKNGIKRPYKNPEIINSKDLVPVVRCEDCKHHSFDAGYGNHWCNLTSGVRKVKPDDFCSYGERREE